MRILLAVMLFGLGASAMERCDLRADVDGDGREDRVMVRGGKLMVVDGQKAKQWVVDARVVTRECYVLELFGRRGVVTLPHGMGVRFYQWPGTWSGGWKYEEVYSFYTASWQGGLVQADVDGDGRLDLFCGNYWIRSPESAELPWRLFAINAYHEHAVSATAQLHWDGKRLLWVESRRPAGRVVWFRPPEDVKQLWIAEPHELSEKLDCPQLVVRDGVPVIFASKRRCR
jgi:hypothetical protein